MIVLCMYAHRKAPPGVCWRQAIFGRLAARPSPPLQHAHLFQPPQPFSKQRARDMRKTALKVIEVIHVGKKLADDQDCPAIGKNLRRTCDRAILAIKVHAATLTQADGAM